MNTGYKPDDFVGVSIICNAYNHEKYIGKAIDGFINQKASFIYEILIHDDASTDNTAIIVREYAEKYPGIIKPFYEKENQYSKHNDEISRIQYGRARGKYIAMCEGDDYWTDPLKLQKQFDAMEKHPEIDMCAHAASKERSGKIIGMFSPRKGDCIIPARDVIRGGGGLFATNSLFYRRSMRENIPQFFQFCGFDYTLQIWGSLRGGILYLPDNMSVYRMGVLGSWTARMYQNPEKYVDHKKRVQKMFDILAQEVDLDLVDVVRQTQEEHLISILEFEHKYHEIKHGEYRSIYKRLSLNRKIKTNLKQFIHYIGMR